MNKIVIRLIIFVTIISLGIYYFTIVTDLSKSGETISNLKQEVEFVEKENRILNLKLSQRYFLSTVQDTAESSGMTADTKFVYVKTPSSLVVSRK